MYLGDSDIPDGFGSVVMPDPAAFIPAGALGENHGTMVCCDDLEWVLGKIVKYKPRATKYQFDIEWATGVTRQQQVDLQKYFLQHRAPRQHRARLLGTIFSSDNRLGAHCALCHLDNQETKRTTRRPVC